MNKLNKSELNELVGGAQTVPPGSGDVENINDTPNCECLYTDNGVIKNINNTTGCKCSCVIKKNTSTY